MASISVTAASVLKGNGAKTEHGIAGATITAGQTLYKDSSDSNKLKLSDANGTAAVATVVGIALHGASSGQPIEYVYEDSDFTPGATLTNGTVYVLGATAAGDIAPVADLTTGWYPSVLFVAKSTTKAVLKIVSSGVVI